jgi:polyisoprenoid-binding protein YceI
MSTTAVGIPGHVAGTYTIDPGHFDVAFTVRHLMVSKVRGHSTRFQGERTLAPDPLASSVTATIELASIDTNNPRRDDDLRSANFFETDTYPTMTFRSVGIRHSEDGFDVDGELTLHGVTRPVTLALDVNGFTRDPYGGTRAGFSATTELDRGDFGISNIPMDGGGVVIGDRIQVFLEVEAVLNPPRPAQPLALTTDFQEEHASRFPDRTRTDSRRPARAPGPGRPTARGGSPRPGPSR